MKVKNAEEFRNAILKELNFQPVQHSNYIYYENPSHPAYGHFLLYERKNFYEFGMADYTIPHSFKLNFQNPSRMIRFGIVYTGTTTFKLHSRPVSSFSPSSFFVIEHHISGQQAWKKGQHFHGIEVTIYADFFNDKFISLTGKNFDYSLIEENYTYHYLPLQMVQILQQLQALSDKGELNPLYLESKIIECMGIIYNEVYRKKHNSFAIQHTHGTVSIGSNRLLHLNTSDIHSIQKAHEILSQNITNPPTIEALSGMVLLNTQKLKAGFSYYYHMTIREYIISLRMSAAAILLSTTDMHIHQIGNEVGYSYPSNFIKMFKQHYGKTPLQYRLMNREKETN